MVQPTYIPDVFSRSRAEHDNIELDVVLYTTPWVQVTDARLECFMSDSSTTYTYGSGAGIRTYTPVPYSGIVRRIQEHLNCGATQDAALGAALSCSARLAPSTYNVCFLNRYDHQKMQLGWHSDDTPGMNHDHPIAVVSFGAQREIWWRPIGQTGVIPQEQRQLLGHGSLFIMPAGFQKGHQHRIPKADREVGTRVSLTYREYISP